MAEYSVENVEDSKVLALTKRINVVADDNMTATFPAKQTATVEVRMRNGEVYNRKVDYPKGEPENPMTLGEMKDKFMSLVVYSGRKESEAEDIYTAVMDIEHKFEELLLYISGTKNHK